jgi:hypothetical protein
VKVQPAEKAQLESEGTRLSLDAPVLMFLYVYVKGQLAGVPEGRMVQHNAELFYSAPSSLDPAEEDDDRPLVGLPYPGRGWQLSNWQFDNVWRLGSS